MYTLCWAAIIVFCQFILPLLRFLSVFFFIFFAFCQWWRLLAAQIIAHAPNLTINILSVANNKWKWLAPKRYLCISRWLQCFWARVCENIEIHRWKPKNYQVEFRQRTKNFRSKNKFCYFAIFDVASRSICIWFCKKKIHFERFATEIHVSI